MKRLPFFPVLGALIGATLAGSALVAIAQQPAPAINPDILTMQRNAAFDDNARLMTMLTAERAAAAALEKYWRDACQSTPECGGTSAKVGDSGLKPVIGQMN